MKRNLIISFFRRLLIGFLLGIIIENVICILFEPGNCSINSWFASVRGLSGEFIIQSLVSGFYGGICLAGTIVYDIERWPLALSSAVHYLLCAVLFVPVAILMHWANSITEILVMEAIQLVLYFIVWRIIYLRYKASIRKLNELMNDKDMTVQKMSDM